MRLPQQTTLGFFLISLTAPGAIYVAAPLFHVEVSSYHSRFFITLTGLYIICTSTFIYYITRKFISRIKAERTLNEQIIYRYEKISNAARDAIWDYDMITGKVYYNLQAQKMFGYSTPEMEQNQLWWEENIHPDDRKRVLDKMDAMLGSDKNVWHDEYSFRCKNGSYKQIQDRSFIVRNEAGVPVRMIGSMLDITLMHQQQRAITEQQLANQRKAGLAVVKDMEEERKKWRTQLHEDINQVLAASKMQLQSDAGNARLQGVVNHLEGAMQKLNLLSNEIRPGLLDDFGLVATISEKLNNFSSAVPLMIDFDYSGFHDKEVNDSVALLLYRIVKEQTEDVITNTDASAIHVAIASRANGKTTLTISDNRLGKKVDDAEKNMLFEELQNHIQIMSGQLKVIHGSTRGLTLVAEV